MSKTCVICKKPVVHEDLCADSELYSVLCERADVHGMQCLTENEQCLVDLHVCSEACYELLS